MPYEIRTTREFSAAHQLRLYDGSLESLHGHNWKVQVTVAAEQLDAIGVVMDFHELERLVDNLLKPWHNRHLNDLPPFQKFNPSAENVAEYLALALSDPHAPADHRLPAGVRLRSVEVWETPTNSAICRP